MTFNAKVEQNTVQGFITLYELDARRLGGEIYRFHGHNDGVIAWQGNEYQPISIEADGLEMRSDGKASSPTLVIHNDIGGVSQALRVLCLRFDDFAGAKLKVIHTLAEYLYQPKPKHATIPLWHTQKILDNKCSNN